MTLLFVLACASEPAAPPAEPAAPAAPPAAVAPAPAPAAPAAPAAGVAWAVDGAASTITASAHKVIGGHDLGFPGAAGSVHVDAGVLTGVEVNVPLANLSVDQEKLRTHLLTPDFFDAATFPEARFRSTSVTGAAPTFTVVGTMELHGKTKELSFPVTVAVEGTTFTGTAEVALDRRDFDLVYPGKPDNLIQDGVELHVKLVAHAP